MDQLALLGGNQSAPYDYEAHCNLPLVPDKAYRTISKMLLEGHISSGPIVREFEEKFRRYVGAEYSLCGVNGTTMIQEALQACGVQPGDEVLAPSYTFWASCAPILACCATPVFCDIDPQTLCIDPADIERKITPKTRAVIVIHVWGVPCDMQAIMAIARKHNIKVVEDAAHAHGARYKDQMVGVLGDVASFSLQGSKTMPAGEGGIMVTNNREIYERCIAMGHYERLKSLPEDSPYRKYFLTGMGYKHRVHPLGIAIADAHLDQLEERNEVRSRQGRYFDAGVADIPFIRVQKENEGGQRVYSYHYYIYDRAAFGGVSMTTVLKALSAEGVVVGNCGYGRLHRAPMFTEAMPEQSGLNGFLPHGPREGSAPPSLPVTEYMAVNTFMAAQRFERECKPVIDGYIEAYHKVFSQMDALIAYEKQHPVLSEEPQSGTSINIFTGK